MRLSDHRLRLPTVIPHPWRRLGTEWPDVRVVRVDLGHRWEITRWERPHPVIYLHHALTQVQRRTAVAHACEHLDRGAPCESLAASIEARVVAATARYLLPDLDAVASALATYDARRAAEELWVPWGVLVDRLNGLTDAESEYVHSRRGEAVA